MSTVKIEKLVFGGQALAHIEDKTAFVWGALPGEEVELEILKKRKGIIEARAGKIISPSVHRVAPAEAHYLCCSPWSVLSPEFELSSKLEIALEVFRRASPKTVGDDGRAPIVLPELTIAPSPEQYGYRNKIEFSFTFGPDNPPRPTNGLVAAGLPSLAFFNRGTHHLIPLTECLLAHPNINTAAKEIVAWVRAAGMTVRNLKSVIIRSTREGDVIAALFIKDMLDLPPLPKRAAYWKGFEVFYSSHKSPASNPDKLLAADGVLELTEKIGNTSLSFGVFSFFQINLPVFESALQDIAEHVPKNAKVVDYYSGVGTIGLAIAPHVASVDLVESNTEACEYAEKNIAANNITNATVTNAPSETILEHITADKTIILDPPRAGLDKRVVAKLLEVKPKRIIYLSCGPDTQARDVALLTMAYKPVFAKVYNFFPRTPHLESLLVLDKID